MSFVNFMVVFRFLVLARFHYSRSGCLRPVRKTGNFHHEDGVLRVKQKGEEKWKFFHRDFR